MRLLLADDTKLELGLKIISFAQARNEIVLIELPSEREPFKSRGALSA